MPTNINANFVFDKKNIQAWRIELQGLAGQSNTDSINKITQLSNLIATGLIFLNNLKNNPGPLVRNFKKEISNSIEKYELLYPIHQSLCVRKACHKLKALSAANFTRLPDRQYQIELHTLCKWLWLIQQHVESNKTSKRDAEFTETLSSLISMTHIKVGGNLPDNLAIPFTLGYIPLEYQDDSSFLIAELEQLEIAYGKLVNQQEFLSAVATQNELFISQAEAVTNILNIIHTSHTQNNLDIKFATKILTATSDLISDPTGMTSYNNYILLADHAEGCPTLGKAFAGYMLRGLGAMVLVTGVAIALVAALAPPLSLSLLAASLIMAASITLFGAGVGLIRLSDTYLENGMRHGLSLEMETAARSFTPRPRA